MKALFFSLLIFFAGLTLNAQIPDTLQQCATDYVNQGVELVDYPLLSPRSDEVLVVPIVFHVIHKGEQIGQGTNISDAQIYSAVEALNQDYRKVPGTNGDGIGVDTKIEFCLAVRDPDGNPTTGINRVDGRVIPLYEEEGITAGQGSGANEVDVKNLSRWPNTYVYNIWVVSEIEDNNGGAGIQGYAYFPTTNIKDGTVILYNATGTVGNLKSYTNMGRTLTHELGHGLNLYHTFQSTSTCTSETNCATQGDRVCDTPPTILNSNCNSPACMMNPEPQMVENYMDYTSQICKDTFTQGQADRMTAALLGSIRAPLLTSLACTPAADYDVGISNIIHPTQEMCSFTFTPVVSLANYGTNTVNSVTIEYGVVGGNIDTFNWVGNLETGQSTNVTLPSFFSNVDDGVFFVETSNPNGQQDENSSNDIETIGISTINGIEVSVTITTDFYGIDTSWEIQDSTGSVVAFGGPYSNGQTGTNYEYILCLPEGCYDFNLYDASGDGICCSYGLGGWNVEDQYGNVFSSGGLSFSNTCGNPPPNPDNANCFEVFTEGFCLSIQEEQDCNGDLNGDAFIDNCGICVGGATGLEPCVQDCNGEFGGTAYVDQCGTCVEGSTGLIPCVEDCNGEFGGEAFIDDCGNCVGGNTGLEPCEQDCSGVLGGAAFIDQCGECVGGNTGLAPCVQDCNNVWGGSAFLDDCEVCVGGTTGLYPCYETACQSDIDILINPYSDDCSDWGTTLFPWTIGYPCITDSRYYSKLFEIGLDDVVDSIYIEICELNVENENGDLRRSFNKYFWMEELGCPINDDNKMQGVIIYDEAGNVVFSIDRNEFAKNIIEQDGLVYYSINDLNLTPGSYEIRVIHDEVENIGWSQNDFFSYNNFGDCFDYNGLIFDNIWLTNTTVGETYIGPEVILSNIIIELVQPEDCNGVPGGTAYLDECGTCVEGDTGLEPCGQDCNNEWGGAAYIDNCDTCVGGATGLEPCEQDCSGDWGGTAFVDECGICVEGNTGLEPCEQDCAEIWGGTAFVDNCGICVGGDTGLEPCDQDCNGVFGGTAYLDNCGDCVGGTTGFEPCEQDCNGDFGGSAYVDECGECVEGTTGLSPCIQDCNGDFGGTAFIDECDICVGGSTDLEPCEQDCDNIWGGTAFIDECGTCVEGTTGLEPCVQDCNGEFGGTAFVDECGECVGGNTGIEPCEQDCNGDWGGTAFVDECGVCVEGTTGLTPCVQDCNGEFGGTAFIDNCGECVGGNTGLNPCVQDCNNTWGGTAFIDNCSVCVEGTTGLTPCVQDCNGDWGGTAFVDECGECVYEANYLSISCPGSEFYTCFEDIPEISSELTYENNCGDVFIEVTQTVLGDICQGFIEKEYMIYDDLDTLYCFQIVTYDSSTVAPVFVNPPADYTSSCEIIPPVENVVAQGGCGEVEITFEQTINSSDTIPIFDAEGSLFGLSIPTFINGSDKYTFEDNSVLVKHNDGTAELIGGIISTVYENKGWDIHLQLSESKIWEEWALSGGSFSDGNEQGAHEQWLFHTILEGSEMMGKLDYEGFYLNLTPAAFPVGNGFQLGQHANTVNSNTGAYVRFYIDGYFNWSSVVGWGNMFIDLGQNISEDCIYEVIRTWTATDVCGNVSQHTQIIMIENCLEQEIDIIVNPYNIFCEINEWGTSQYPYTEGFPCITDAKYYSKHFVVESGFELSEITLNACELNTRDEFNNLRRTFHNYFWFDGECSADDLQLMPGLVIYNQNQGVEYYMNRNQFALAIDSGTLVLDDLNLGEGEYELRVIHEEVFNIGWDVSEFYQYNSFGDCLDMGGFIAGNIWINNTFVGESFNGPEVVLNDIELSFEPESEVGNPHLVFHDFMSVFELSVFPNPTSGDVIMVCNHSDVVMFSAFDLSGKEIMKGTLQPGYNKVSFDKKGIFIIKAKDKAIKLIVL